MLSAIKRNLISSKLSFPLFLKYYCRSYAWKHRVQFFFFFLLFLFSLSFYVSHPKNFCYWYRYGFIWRIYLVIQSFRISRKTLLLYFEWTRVCLYLYEAYALQSMQTVRDSLKKSGEEEIAQTWIRYLPFLLRDPRSIRATTSCDDGASVGRSGSESGEAVFKKGRFAYSWRSGVTIKDASGGAESLIIREPRAGSVCGWDYSNLSPSLYRLR